MTKKVALFVDHEEIILTKNGEWLSNGNVITHNSQIKAFSKNIRKDKNGYLIQIMHEKKKITVEDTPFFVISVNDDSMILNDGSEEKIEFKNLRYSPERLTSIVKENDPDWTLPPEAKFIRSAYHQLLKQIQEDDHGYFIKSKNSGKHYLEKK